MKWRIYLYFKHFCVSILSDLKYKLNKRPFLHLFKSQIDLFPSIINLMFHNILIINLFLAFSLNAVGHPTHFA